MNGRDRNPLNCNFQNSNPFNYNSLISTFNSLNINTPPSNNLGGVNSASNTQQHNGMNPHSTSFGYGNSNTALTGFSQNFSAVNEQNPFSIQSSNASTFSSNTLAPISFFNTNIPQCPAPNYLGVPTILTCTNVQNMKRKNEIVSHFSKSSLDAVYCYKKNYSYEASQEMEYIRREYCRRKCSKLAEIGASMTDVVASKFDMYVIMEKRYFSSPCESGSNSSNSNNNVGVNFLNNANAYNVVYEIGLPPTVSPQAHFMRVFPQNNPGILNEKLKNLLKETCDRDLNVMSFRSDVIADIGCAFGINAEMITVGEFIHELRKRACAPIASFRCSMEIEGEDNASGNAFDVGNKSTSGAEVVYVQIGISVPDNMK